MEHADIAPIALFLSVAFLGGFLLQRLKQPVLVGYMLVGAIVGPAIVHENGPAISWLSELAIIILMFMLGLELDITRFRRSMRSALWVVGLQVILGLLFMFGFSYLFAWSWQIAILLGFVIALSSTAVAVGMLDNLNETDSAVGRLTIAVLVAQDLAVVPMLLIINTLGSGSFLGGEMMRFGISLLVVVISLLAIFEIYRHPQWVKKLERLFLVGKGQPAVAGLALAFGAAAASSSLGLSSAYGAFAMGLLIGNTGEIGASYRHAIHSIHDLLMMTFFISVGLMLDLSFVFHHWIEIASILAITLLLKVAVNAGILYYFLGTSKNTALTMGALLGQIGEFSFVIIALGLSDGFITSNGYQLALAVIALSLACSPIILQLTRRYLRMHPSPAYGELAPVTCAAEQDEQSTLKPLP